ncbi:MAG: hypothetical protein IID33_11110 [Planctomycetes bacterium]|nr:hypothetical protein [Planctomycetota bacterium]
MATTIAKMAVVLSANTKQFESGLARASTRAKKFGVDFAKIGKVLAKGLTVIAVAAAAMAAAVVAGLVAITKAGFTSIDALAKTAVKLNISTEALAGFRLSAKFAGVEVKVLEKALQQLNVGIADAARGMGEAMDALLDLGLDPTKLVLLKLEDQFRAVVDAWGGVEARRKIDIAFGLFGARGTALINILNEGKKGLEETADQAERFGRAISGTDAAGVERANDAMERIGQILAGIGEQLAKDIAPLVEHLATVIIEGVNVVKSLQTVARFGLGVGKATGAKFFDTLSKTKRVGAFGLEVLGAQQDAANLRASAKASQQRSFDIIFSNFGNDFVRRMGGQVSGLSQVSGADRPAGAMATMPEMLQEMREVKEAVQTNVAVNARMLRIAESGAMP